MPTVDDVPASDVGEVVQGFVDEGRTRIVVTRNADGTFRVDAQ